MVLDVAVGVVVTSCASTRGIHLTAIYMHGTRCSIRGSGHFICQYGGPSAFGIYISIGLYILIS